MVTDYRTQQQMNDVFRFGVSLMFLGIMLGLVRTLLVKALEPEEDKPELLPQVTVEGGGPVPYPYRYLTGWLREPLPEYSLAVEPTCARMPGKGTKS